jgi:hypothetical protein
MTQYDCHDRMVGFQKAEIDLSAEEWQDLSDKRDTNRGRLKGGLKRDGEPNPVGCHTQGSYAMDIMTQHPEKDYDIDDGVYFTKDSLVGPRGGDKSPGDAKEMVRKAVHDEKFSKAPEVRTNCVRVYYNEGFHVDIPVYRRTRNADGTFSYELASVTWRESDPREVTRWFRKAVKDKSANLTNGGQLRRITRLIKGFARSRESWRDQIATGFMIAKLVVEHFVQYESREDISLRETMRAIHYRLKHVSLEVEHPVLDEMLTRDDEDSRTAFLRDKLEWALGELEVLDKWDCTETQANKAWDKVFATTYFTDGTTKTVKGVTSAAIIGQRNFAEASRTPVDPRGSRRYG